MDDRPSTSSAGYSGHFRQRQVVTTPTGVPQELKEAHFKNCRRLRYWARPQQQQPRARGGRYHRRWRVDAGPGPSSGGGGAGASGLDFHLNLLPHTVMVKLSRILPFNDLLNMRLVDQEWKGTVDRLFSQNGTTKVQIRSVEDMVILACPLCPKIELKSVHFDLDLEVNTVKMVMFRKNFGIERFFIRYGPQILTIYVGVLVTACYYREICEILATYLIDYCRNANQVDLYVTTKRNALQSTEQTFHGRGFKEWPAQLINFVETVIVSDNQQLRNKIHNFVPCDWDVSLYRS